MYSLMSIERSPCSNRVIYSVQWKTNRIVLHSVQDLNMIMLFPIIRLFQSAMYSRAYDTNVNRTRKEEMQREEKRQFLPQTAVGHEIQTIHLVPT